jgi:hypothetical protein
VEVYSFTAVAMGGLRGNPDCSLCDFESRIKAGEEAAGADLPVCGVIFVIWS